MDFLLEYYIQFFCLEKPIGLTLSCLEWPKPMLLAQNCILIVFYGDFTYSFFCLEKPIGLTLSCLEWLNPMLLPQNCMNLSFNYYFKSTTLNSLILAIIYTSNQLILLCQELMVQLYIRILSPCSSVSINLRPYRSEVHH